MQPPPRPLFTAPPTPLPPPASRRGPDKIAVPNCDTLYVQGRKYYEFRLPGQKLALETYYHEGWKLHVPLPDSGYLAPPARVSYNLIHELPFDDYCALASDKRKGHFNLKILCFSGYCDAFAYLQTAGIPHKFVPTRTLLKLQENDDEETQKGKFLTIYPNGEEEMLEAISRIETHLKLMFSKGCFTFAKQEHTREKRVGSLELITARYGSFVDLEVLKPLAQTRHLTVNSSKAAWADDDRRNNYRPDHIRDPFALHSPENNAREPGWYHHCFGLNADPDNYDILTRRNRT